MKSWKTTVAGILAILVSIFTAVGAMLDSDPATVADWSVVISTVIAGIGLLMARDNNVTSEAAGAKPPTV